ncbi:MAG: type II toxin-antitoxin system VapC family toxin [Phycisphaerae bacterium]|nr:type II toxin-antitoxin system VapC family toxin [Planctomycetota bacterium]MBL7219218.1 type II toxin-antitoxin system VapC family toxin [Phycisphaerae bacterium]
MKVCVIDASVIAAAFFQEQFAQVAAALLASARPLHAPDLVISEVANVIWKRQRRNEIDSTEAAGLLADFQMLPLNITSSSELVESALELALGTGRTVYDCLYLALAVKTESIMASADKRLVNALVGTPLDKHIVWIGDRK